MTIKAQINPDNVELGRRVTVCVLCAGGAAAPLPAVCAESPDGQHRLDEREVCPRCGGVGSVADRGREHSRDPRDWNGCGRCEGVGVLGLV